MPDSVIKSAGRVFEVLELFRARRRALGVREIAEHFGYPLSSTAVLLKSLSTLGYLSHDESARAYFPTVRVALLGEWIYESMFDGAGATALVDAIADATGETVLLAVCNGVNAQYVHVRQSRHEIQFYISPGTRRPLCMSGTGWAILSTLDDAAIESIYARTHARLPRGSVLRRITLAQVLAQVQGVRASGYAYSRGMVTPGGGVIAMPLPVTGGARLAVAVAGIVERLERDERAIVRTMKAQIRRYLRGRSADAAPAEVPMHAPARLRRARGALAART
ncbi:MAG: IclR family transcriptional regulator [Gammaproteobacteria bacterium]